MSSPNHFSKINFKSQPVHDPSFVERHIDEAEDAFMDENGFTRTPNGSFWDNQGEYFNREGFDIHGGYYDKYCIYIPGPGYDEEKRKYKDEEELFIMKDGEGVIKNENIIEGLKEQEDQDMHVVNNVNGLEENIIPEDDDYVEENGNNSFKDEEIKNVINEISQFYYPFMKIGINEGNKENVENNGNIGNMNNGGNFMPFKDNNEKKYFTATVINENKEDYDMK